jgi:hypothetical protein
MGKEKTMANVTPPPNQTYPIRSTTPGSGSWVRAVNVAAGLWLFISAFLWPHSPGSMTNTWVVGLLIAAIGAIGTVAPDARWLNTAVAVWLFFSTVWVYPSSPATVWNNVIVAIVVFVLSLVANRSSSRPRVT